MKGPQLATGSQPHARNCPTPGCDARMVSSPEGRVHPDADPSPFIGQEQAVGDLMQAVDGLGNTLQKVVDAQ